MPQSPTNDALAELIGRSDVEEIDLRVRLRPQPPEPQVAVVTFTFTIRPKEG